MNNLQNEIQNRLGNTIENITFDKALNAHYGKVRDSFIFEKNRAIVVSDRVSSFDFILGTIPFKGAVLNQIAAWWFRELDKLNIPHHIINCPHSNITLAKNAKVMPIEVIVRGYLTGSTKTSSWYAYQNNDRTICGVEMPANMKKNEKFPEYIITPTTKPTEIGQHDENISEADVISQGHLDGLSPKYTSEELWEKARNYALTMFAHGQKVAAERGLILVDTKYEMGVDADGELIVIDEVHTPDSSRYWVAETYESRLLEGKEPQGLDKEFVRQMIIAAGYDVDNDEDPAKYMNDEIRTEAAIKYLDLFEKMTGKKFSIKDEDSIEEVLETLID